MVTLRRSLPPINALVVFEVAARHRNLTAAGAELCIAPSAVSRHVATVERETGITLFKRKGNKLELTLAGQRLADAIGAGLAHVRDVLVTLKQREAGRTLTIACSHDMAQHWLMPRFAQLADALADRALRVITADSYENFDAPDIDLSVRFGDGHWPGFNAVHLFDEEGFPVCAPALLERHPELLNAPPAVLGRFPLLRLATEDQLGLKWSDWLRAEGVGLPVVHGPVFPNFTVLLLELMAARGIALGYSHVIDHLLLEGRLGAPLGSFGAHGSWLLRGVPRCRLVAGSDPHRSHSQERASRARSRRGARRDVVPSQRRWPAR